MKCSVLFWVPLIIILVILIAISLFILFTTSRDNNTLPTEKSYFVFLLVLISFLLIFIGFILKKIFLINLGTGSLFIGIILLELFIIFPTFLNIKESSINLEKCEKEIYIKLSSISCIIIGYKPSQEESSIDIITFWIFILILPFAVIYAITFGLFFGIGLDQLFGQYGKPVVGIIAFATAMYGMRQLIGPFLIDLLAYGVWGIFGILVSVIITSSIRFIFLKTFRETEEIRKSVLSLFRLSEINLFDRIDEFIKDVENVLTSKHIDRLSIEDIDRYINQTDIYLGNLKGIKDSTSDEKTKIKCDEYIKKLEEVKKRAEEVRKIKEKKLPPPPPYYSSYHT